jgi:hypothetical protein
MRTTDALEQIAGVDAAALEAMVEPDRHRPGRARYRLIAEEIPIWPLIGLVHHFAGTTEPDAITPKIIAAVAENYGISETAVAAAAHYYVNYRCPIDALLEENTAALE